METGFKLAGQNRITIRPEMHKAYDQILNLDKFTNDKGGHGTGYGKGANLQDH
jgi:hypothetical protein